MILYGLCLFIEKNLPYSYFHTTMLSFKLHWIASCIPVFLRVNCSHMSFIQRNMHNLTFKLTVIFGLVFYLNILWNKQCSIVFLFTVFLCQFYVISVLILRSIHGKDLRLWQWLLSVSVRGLQKSYIDKNQGRSSLSKKYLKNVSVTYVTSVP